MQNSDKKLSSLVEDIYALFDKGPLEISDEEAREFGHELGLMLTTRLSEERGKPSLRLSNLGKPPRQLWYTINTPEKAEPLSATSRIKFLMGDIAEALVIFLAKRAGHTVTDEQKEVQLAGVKGHIDGLIDGELCDVKSASPFSFGRFSDGLKPEQDSFGYLTQLGSYAAALDKRSGAFVALEKVLGKLVVDQHGNLKSKEELEKLVEARRAMLAGPNPPPRCYPDEAEGKSGNRKLGVVCSYCPFKQTCWPGLRTFLYSRGPVFLTVVQREPKDVPEA